MKQDRALIPLLMTVAMVFGPAARDALADTHYVSLDGHAVSPYTNWYNAATNIYPQSLNDAAVVAGDTIIVSNGVYTNFPSSYAINAMKAVTITSLYGAATTIFDGRGAAVNAIYNSSATTATVYGLTISNWNGSGVRLSDRDPGPGIVLVNCTITRNVAGIENIHGTVWATNCIILNNAGVGVYASGWTNVLDGCKIIGNSNGGVYATRAQTGMTLRNCEIRDNYDGRTSAGGAGGVYLADTATNCLVVNCSIVSNRSYVGVGGARMAGASVIQNCLVACNIATGFNVGVAYAQAGGVSLGSGGTMRNCTVVSNWGGNYAAGPGGLAGGNCTSINSIVYFNQSFWAPAYSNYATGATIAWTNGCTAPLPPLQSGTTTSNPAFVDVPGGNLHLLKGSPCINAGFYEFWMNNAVDLDGRPRIREGIVDMGAYEYFPMGTVLMFR